MTRAPMLLEGQEHRLAVRFSGEVPPDQVAAIKAGLRDVQCRAG